MPAIGSERLSLARTGLIPKYSATSPASANTATGTQFDQGAGNGGVQPPRKSSVATQVTVIMLQYSAMKNDANFMLLYSVWKPATNSFSASGRSNGTRLVSANAAHMKTRNPKICGAGPWKMVHCGSHPQVKPDCRTTISRKLSVLTSRSGATTASARGSS